MHLRLPSEILHKEYSHPPANPISRDGLFELNKHHPVVAAARRRGVPQDHIALTSLYWDGVRYTQRETFIGFFINDLVRRLSWLVFLVRICSMP